MHSFLREFRFYFDYKRSSSFFENFYTRYNSGLEFPVKPDLGKKTACSRETWFTDRSYVKNRLMFEYYDFLDYALNYPQDQDALLDLFSYRSRNPYISGNRFQHYNFFFRDVIRSIPVYSVLLPKSKLIHGILTSDVS